LAALLVAAGGLAAAVTGAGAQATGGADGAEVRRGLPGGRILILPDSLGADTLAPRVWADTVLVPAPADTTALRPTARTGTAADTVRAVPAVVDTARAAGPAGLWYREPKWIMLRSLVVPGWGQWANRKRVKAIVVAAGEGYLIWRAIDYGRLEQRKKEAARDASANPALQTELLGNSRYAASRRRDFTWWTIFAAVLSMGDAYVDAHLGRFDPEFEPQDGSGGFVLDRTDGFRLGVRWRLP